MKYFSTEATILRMFLKVKQRRPGVFQMLSDGEKPDLSKVRQKLVSNGVTLPNVLSAISTLQNTGYINFQGITPSGETFLTQMDIARRAEIERLGLAFFFDGAVGMGQPDELKLLELSQKEY